MLVGVGFCLFVMLNIVVKHVSLIVVSTYNLGP